MKKILKFTVLSAVLLILAGLMFSCEKEHIPRPFEIGIYVQVFDDPSIDERRRLRIEVIDDHMLVIIHPVLNPELPWYPEIRDKFSYKMLRGNRIELTPMWIEEVPLTFHFRWINNRRFETNLFSHNFIVIFEKE